MKLQNVYNYWKHKTNLFITILGFYYGIHLIFFPPPFSSLDAVQKFTASLNCEVVYHLFYLSSVPLLCVFQGF